MLGESMFGIVRGFLRLILLVVCVASVASVATAEITLISKNISYDPASGVIRASGGVIVTQLMEDGSVRELHSENIEYNKKTGKIKLIGKSMIKEPTGDILSTENVELDAATKNAIVKALVVVLKDSAKIKAQKGTKVKDVFTFENATYSPCKETSCSVPLWDLVAEKVIYDRKSQKFIYKNVKLRIKGTPIFFTPYFSHPSHEVKRKTGVLTPILRYHSDTGLYVGIPVYIAIAPDKDLRMTPYFSTKGRWLAGCEYRQKFVHGDFDISASVLKKKTGKRKGEEVTTGETTILDTTAETTEAKPDPTKHTRWHVDATYISTRFDKKRLTIRLNRSSDVTYKAIYPIGTARHIDNDWLSEKYNDSKAVLDSYDHNYFLKTEAHYYQTSDKYTAPVLCPHINLNARKTGIAGGTVAFDSDVAYLNRKKEKSLEFSKEFFRISNKLSWSRAINVNVVLLEIDSGFRADIYSISETRHANTSKSRIFPIIENQVSVSVPYTCRLKNTNQMAIFGPKVALNSVETSRKRANLEQNEDSIFDSTSDLNLYSLRRYGGYDAIEHGERVSVGFESSVYDNERRWLNIFVGKSQAIGNRQKSKFAGKNTTVGRITLKPNDNFAFRMRYVGLPATEKPRLLELGAETTIMNVTIGAGYFYDAKESSLQKNGISQFGVNCAVKINALWSLSASQVINLKRKNGKKNLACGGAVRYEDECFELRLGIYRTNFKEADIKPKTGVVLAIVFKTLGALAKSTGHYSYEGQIGNVA
ncbi:MAG: LPS assembly protein LptD [Holosporales bacterium]|jgi:LPS-assembly protein|nr:LPS assembly protein LptD [Holosporales bacterium]